MTDGVLENYTGALLEPFVAAHYRPEPKRKHRRNPIAEGEYARGREKGEGGTPR